MACVPRAWAVGHVDNAGLIAHMDHSFGASLWVIVWAIVGLW